MNQGVESPKFLEIQSMAWRGKMRGDMDLGLERFSARSKWLGMWYWFSEHVQDLLIKRRIT